MPTEELHLQDIVKSIDSVGRFLNGVEEAKVLTDEILQNAVLMKLSLSAKRRQDCQMKYASVTLKLNGNQ